MLSIILMSCESGGSGTFFTIVTLPDTQGYVEKYPEVFTQQCQWIIDNKDRLNIKFVVHVGDLINIIRAWGTDDVIEAEWINADAAMSLLDGQVPYLVVPGNHDYENNLGADPPPIKSASARDLTFFNSHFGYSRFEDYQWYGGHFPDDSNANSYAFFTVEEQEFLVMGLEMLPPDEVLSWARGVLDDNRDKHVILVTHMYLTDTGSREWAANAGGANYNFLTWNDPQDIWDELVSLYPNIDLVICGHDVTTDGVARRIDYVDGEPINQIIANYQAPQLEPHGGNGWLRYYRFELEYDRIEAVTYSPYLKQYKTDSQNKFRLELRVP